MKRARTIGGNGSNLASIHGDASSIEQSSDGLTQSVARMQQARDGVSESRGGHIRFQRLSKVIAGAGSSRSRLIQLVCVCRKYFLGMRFTNRCFPPDVTGNLYLFLRKEKKRKRSKSFVPVRSRGSPYFPFSSPIALLLFSFSLRFIFSLV